MRGKQNRELHERVGRLENWFVLALLTFLTILGTIVGGLAIALLVRP